MIIPGGSGNIHGFGNWVPRNESWFALLNSHETRTGGASLLANAGRARRRRSCFGLTALHRAAYLGTPRQADGGPFAFPAREVPRHHV